MLVPAAQEFVGIIIDDVFIICLTHLSCGKYGGLLPLFIYHKIEFSSSSI